MSVRTELMRFIIFDFMLVLSWAPAPKAGSGEEVDAIPIRARKRSSERIAMAFTRRTETWKRPPKLKKRVAILCYEEEL